MGLAASGFDPCAISHHLILSHVRGNTLISFQIPSKNVHQVQMGASIIKSESVEGVTWRVFVYLTDTHSGILTHQIDSQPVYDFPLPVPTTPNTLNQSSPRFPPAGVGEDWHACRKSNPTHSTSIPRITTTDKKQELDNQP